MQENHIENVFTKLWKTFWISIAIPSSLFIAVVIVHQLNREVVPPGSIRFWGISLLILSVAFGVALPVSLRTSLHGKYIKLHSVNLNLYLAYQRKLISVCSAAVVFASLAYLFIVSPLYMYGSVLAALYGIYSSLPFNDKISRELKLYKLDGQA